MKACNLNHLWGRLIVEELIRNGISEFCLSPGSRSTPLAVAVAERSDIHATVHFDERGSAFRALGIAKATGRPAVLICTSGTAVANNYPAIIEASQSATPLIILSADRPAELRDCGASQTINQVAMFGSYLRWSFDLLPADEQVKPEFVLSTVDQAVHMSLHSPAGPVHLNCQFREPLAPLGKEQDYSSYTVSIKDWANRTPPYTTCVNSDRTVSDSNIKSLIDAMRSSKRGVVIAGTLPAYLDVTPIVRLAEQWQWPLIADITSGTRFTECENSGVICHSDLYLRHEHLRSKLRPDVVLQFGTSAISKSVVQYAATASTHYIVVADRPDRVDPLHCVTCQISTDPCTLAKQLASESDIPASNLLKNFSRYDEVAQQCLKAMSTTGEQELSELQVVGEVFRLSAASRGMFLATSMPIREADIVARQSDTRLFVAANRGVNGIDGTIASAAGFAEGLGLPVTLLIGDIASLHDLNSLAILQQSHHPVIMVVLNNDGGGIFSLLPVASIPQNFEKFFATPHGCDFRYAAEMFGLKYHNPASLKDFTTVYRHAMKSKKSALIEVHTSRVANARQHQSLWEAVRDRIETQI